jgi:hypothetical protein
MSQASIQMQGALHSPIFCSYLSLQKTVTNSYPLFLTALLVVGLDELGLFQGWEIFRTGSVASLSAPCLLGTDYVPLSVLTK